MIRPGTPYQGFIFALSKSPRDWELRGDRFLRRGLHCPLAEVFGNMHYVWSAGQAGMDRELVDNICYAADGCDPLIPGRQTNEIIRIKRDLYAATGVRIQEDV